jgi:hypothetical protein
VGFADVGEVGGQTNELATGQPMSAVVEGSAQKIGDKVRIGDCHEIGSLLSGEAMLAACLAAMQSGSCLAVWSVDLDNADALGR